MRLPTDRQRQILDFLAGHLADQGRPPTLFEVANAFGIHLNAVRKHLQALAAKGLIERDAGKARGLRLPGTRLGALPRHPPLALPLVGRVAAGTPILSEGNVEASFAVDPALFRPRPHFLLRVEGDSMIDAGIRDGDLIAVHRTPDAEHGQIVVARLDGEITVKRLERRGERLRLLPANPAYAPIAVGRGLVDFAIEGLYVGSIRRG